jgi:hypothetical protein
LSHGSEIILIDLNSEIREVAWLVTAPYLLSTSAVDFLVEAGGLVSGVGVNAGLYTDIVGMEETITVTTLPGMHFTLMILTAVIGTTIVIIVVIVLIRRVRHTPETSFQS